LQIGLPQGLKMLHIFKHFEPETSLLDDFEFYEEKQRQKLAKKNSAVQHSDDFLMVLMFWHNILIFYREKFELYWFWLTFGIDLMKHKGQCQKFEIKTNLLATTSSLFFS
jgi:hypothetical protein